MVDPDRYAIDGYGHVVLTEKEYKEGPYAGNPIRLREVLPDPPQTVTIRGEEKELSEFDDGNSFLDGAASELVVCSSCKNYPCTCCEFVREVRASFKRKITQAEIEDAAEEFDSYNNQLEADGYNDKYSFKCGAEFVLKRMGVK